MSSKNSTANSTATTSTTISTTSSTTSSTSESSSTSNSPSNSPVTTRSIHSLGEMSEQEYFRQSTEIVAAQAKATTFFELRLPKNIKSLLENGTSDTPDPFNTSDTYESSGSSRSSSSNAEGEDAEEAKFIKNISEQVASFSETNEDAGISSSILRSTSGGSSNPGSYGKVYTPYYERNNRNDEYHRKLGVITAISTPLPRLSSSAFGFVYKGDCLEVGLQLKRQLGLNPVVLNMASHKRPGGGK